MRTLLAVLTLGVVLSGCDNREAPVPYGKPSAPDGKVIKQAQVKDPVCGMMIDSDKAKDHTYKDVNTTSAPRSVTTSSRRLPRPTSRTRPNRPHAGGGPTGPPGFSPSGYHSPHGR
jgi:hypothetical protein